MSIWRIISGILLFAAVTAVLYTWGLKKSVSQMEDLERILLSKGCSRVMKYLNQHYAIDLKEMSRLVQGLKAGMFWSKNRVEVQDPLEFSGKLAGFMLEQRLLEKAGGNQYRKASGFLGKEK